MNPTMFDPIALENWYADEENSLLLQTELEKYFQNYLPCFHSKPQRKLFRTFILGLLSPQERKPIEPIALHFSGEKYVRPMQQFFSRSLLRNNHSWIFTMDCFPDRSGRSRVYWQVSIIGQQLFWNHTLTLFLH